MTIGKTVAAVAKLVKPATGLLAKAAKATGHAAKSAPASTGWISTTKTAVRDLTSYVSDAKGLRAVRDLLGPQFAGARSYAEIFQETRPALRPLAKEDLASLLVYSMETVPGMGYREINAALRSGGAAQKRLDPLIRSTASALNQLKPFRGTVHRGAAITAEELSRYQSSVGQALAPERAFTSTSLDKTVASRFAKERAAVNGKLPVLFDIASAKHGHLLPYSRYPGEQEVLFPPGVTFEVLGIKKRGALTLISLREAHG